MDEHWGSTDSIRPPKESALEIMKTKSCVKGIDHIQVAAPHGCEIAAREFFGSILGLKEIEKPSSLRARGGCWFQCGDQQLHVGVERDFHASKKAHVAFAVRNLASMRKTLLERSRIVVDDDAILETRRFYSEDPWGNRIEFVEVK